MPTRIDFARGKTIKYTYSADGRKLRAEYTSMVPLVNKTIDYCGNLVFENGVLKQMLFDGGYVPVEDRSGAYVFYVKDHLGNNRMAVSQNGTIEQTYNYYPFGGLMANSTGWTGQHYKYNGKEFDRMHGLDWYDYGARWMDASIGRWHSMDPLCEKYYNISPYVYCMNNPVKFIDPDGRDIVLVYKNRNGEQCQLRVSNNNLKYVHSKNQFVSDFFKAFNYNCKNGGGKYMKEAFNKHSYTVYVYDATDNLTEKDDTEFYIDNGKKISWESRKGLITEEGGRQSAATRLEHEFYHAWELAMNGRDIHEAKRKTAVDKYDNQQEKEAVEAENLTAERNGEAKRYSHRGSTFDATSSISTMEKDEDK